jgi:hypothetical protein
MYRIALVLALIVPLGCAASSGQTCTIGSDCPSGACAADGTCVPVGDDDAAGGTGGGGASTSSSGGAGGSSSSSSGGSGQGGGGLCPANGDEVIEESELVLEAGLSANLRVAQAATVDTAGSEQPDGSRIWDFTVSLSGDHAAVVETMALDGAWYADEFPSATYAARLTDADDLLGVYEVMPNKLVLLGVVSPDDGATRTELAYDPPVVVLDLPLSLGKMWTTNTTVSGLAQGVAAYYFEDYAFEVDTRGEAKTPLGDFDVLRVHSELVRTVGGFPTTVQSHAFMSECFGTVASVTSEDHELEVEFTEAAEVRRLSP